MVLVWGLCMGFVFCYRRWGERGGGEVDGTVEFGVGGGCEVGDEGGERRAVTEGGAEHDFVNSVVALDERRAGYWQWKYWEKQREENDVGKVGCLKRVRMICFLRTKRVEKNVLWVFTKTNSLIAQTREVVAIN